MTTPTPKQRLIEALNKLNEEIRTDKTIEYGILYNGFDYYAGCDDNRKKCLKLIEEILPNE